MRNTLTESVLSKHTNVKWEYIPSIPLASIDRERSHRNQARISAPLHHDTVSQYTAAMKNGDEFPALVLFPDAANRYVAADGNHRIDGALGAGKVVFDAYVVHTDDPATRLLITFELNSILNGLSPDQDDRDHQAVFLVDQGLTRESVAKHLNMSSARVSDLLAERTAGDRAVSLGLAREWKKINARQVRISLNRLKLDPVFALAVTISAKYDLQNRDLKHAINDVLSGSTEVAQLATLNKFEELLKAQIKLEKERAEKRPNRPKRSGPMSDPVTRFRAHVKFFVNVEQHLTVAGMNAEERENMVALIKDAQAGLEKALEIASA